MENTSRSVTDLNLSWNRLEREREREKEGEDDAKREYKQFSWRD